MNREVLGFANLISFWMEEIELSFFIGLKRS